MSIYQNKIEFAGLEVDQSIDIILSNFKVLDYLYINNIEGSKIDLDFKNKIVRND
jgi:hypothetical protein